MNKFKLQISKQIYANLASIILTFFIGILGFLFFSILFKIPFFFLFLAVLKFSAIYLLLGIIAVNLLNYFYFKSIKYEFNKKEIVIKSGIIAKSEKIMPYSKIQHIVITRDFFQRMLGLSTVFIQTARPEFYPNQGQNNQVILGPSIPALLNEDAEEIKIFIINKILKSKKIKDI